MKLTSFGAADGVTGSKHLVDVGGSRILLDCGLFQGSGVAVATGGAAYGARVGAALGASWSAGALGLWVSLRLMTLGP